MINLEAVLLELVKPIVDDPSSVSVKQMASLDESEIVLYVYAKNEDIARLIGKQGSMASSIRNMMAIGSRKIDKRINIKFESY
jgi:uncharacterized protein